VAAKRKGKVTAQPGLYAFRALNAERGELTCADMRRRIAPPIAVGRRGEDAMALTIRVNGNTHSVDVDDDTPLLWVLRDVLGMTGTKFGCGMALCGACTVHVDGAPTRSCITPIDSVGTSEITTIEAIATTAAGAKIQKAWLDREVPQCGYCQSGQIMSAAALLASNPRPTDADIDDAMSGNICRCGTYVRIRDAIKQAAQSI
jgi:isoquinoline 1-oxidoreductase subunit alpha